MIFYQIYHFCHEDGKQDTFHCSYGTAFNEYLGTCDHEAAVHCVSAEGYAGPAAAPAPYHAPAPAPYAPAPAPYVPAPSPAPYVPAPAPAPYVPAPAPTPAPYHSITPFVAHAPASTPYAPSPAPAPYNAPTPFVAHAPAPYHPAPAPYHPAPPAPLAYEQSAPSVSGLLPFTQF